MQIPRDVTQIYDECRKNCEAVNEAVRGPELLEVMKYGALMEIAAQLAALRAKFGSMNGN